VKRHKTRLRLVKKIRRARSFKIFLLTVAQLFAMVARMTTKIQKGLALFFIVAVTLAPLPAVGQSTDQQPGPGQQPVGEELGYGFGTVLANVFYMPAKITYAGLGLLAGGLGYVLSAGRADVANNIIYPAVRGHYVITPSHLKGTEPVYFVGAPPLEPETPTGTPTAQR
jgi:hypothetical protein